MASTLTAEMADYLLNLDKLVVVNGQQLHHHTLALDYPLNFRLALESPDDDNQSLLVSVFESPKAVLKVSLHHQDETSHLGILRLCYGGRHKNPEAILPTLPLKFHNHAGKWLEKDAPHMHYVVDGYPELAWALPLHDDEFPVKTLDHRDNINRVLLAFFKKINLKTEILCITQTSLV